MQGQNLPPETIQALRAARAAGATISALMTQYGFTGRTIHKHTFGLSPRTQKVYDFRTSARIITLLLEFGTLTVAEMVEKTGQHRSFVHKKLKELRAETVVERFKFREDDFYGRTRDFYRLTRAELRLM